MHRITAAIAALGLDIVSARVATLGNAVVDTFYVHAGGVKVRPAGIGGSPSERRASCRALWKKALGRNRPGGTS